MTKEPENPLKKRLLKIPVIQKIVKMLKSIRLGKGSFTLYDLLKLTELVLFHIAFL